MANNTNPQAILFVNTQLRPACDRFISALRTLRQLQSNYSAQGIGPLVAGTAELQNELMADGSDVDGRTPLLGYDVDAALGKVSALLTWVDSQAGLEAALTKPTVNSSPVF